MDQRATVNHIGVLKGFQSIGPTPPAPPAGLHGQGLKHNLSHLGDSTNLKTIDILSVILQLIPSKILSVSLQDPLRVYVY